MTSWSKITRPSVQSWTKAAKPATSSSNSTVGQPIGLLLALTYSTDVRDPQWIDVVKPTNTSWTTITKPS